MPGPLISIGGVGIDVIPNATGVYARLATQVLPDAERFGDDAGRAMGRRLQSGIADGVRDGMRAGGRAAVAQATREGGQAGGAFGRAMRTRLEAALRSLPDIRIDANTSAADADIQALRVRLETLRNQRIGIDIDAGRARTEAAEIEEQLRRLGASHPNVQMRVDTAAARAALAEFRAELERLDRTSASPRIEVEGGFAQRLRAAVEAAQAQLPVINIDASTSEAAAQIQSLRGQLESLRTARVGIDVDAATALARINEIQARLAAISASNATADVRVDAAGAAATLAAIQAQVSALDGNTARIDIDVSSAAAGLVRLTTLGASIAPALVPAFGAATFALGAFTSLLSTAVVGVGLFAAAAAPGLVDVGQAVMATAEAEEALAAAQDKTARGAAKSAIAAQQQALALEGAQASLANAHRSSAQQISDAQERVRDAIGRVSDAQGRVAEAAQRVVDAQEKVADAERAVADARAQAADRMDAALDRITDAERSRTSAVRDAERAELALRDARRAAQEQLEDLNSRVEGGAVAERRAALAVKRAQEDLDAVKKSGAKADSDAAVEAQLAYDEAALRLRDLQRENKRTAAEAAAANKAGVDGSREVKDAQQGVVDAQQRVRDAAEAVTDAQEEARRTQVAGARAIADAQKGVVDAQRGVAKANADVARAEEGVAKARAQVADAELGVARARVQGAQQVQSAERALEAAQLAAAAAAEQSSEAMTAANTALDKQKRALADLTPEQRGVYDAVIRLKDGFKAWGDSLAPATMPLVTRAINGLTNLLPKLTPLVLASAEGLERLGDRGKKAFEDPFWDRFKTNLIENLPRAIESMGVVFGNVFVGMAGIINAFLPQTDQIATSMEEATGSFRRWGQGLDEAKSFRDFSDYVHKTWPGVREMFSDVGGALWQITQALSDISPSAVLILQGIATAIDSTPVWVIQTLINAFFAFKVAVFAVATAQAVYAGAMALYSTVTALATGATWSFSAALRAVSSANFIVFLLTIAGTFTLLMIQSEGFRNKVIGVFKEIGSWGVWLYREAIKPAWDGIAAAGIWLYQNAIKPAFDGISASVRAVGDAAVWLWDNAIRPSFDAISVGARVLAAVIAVLLVAPVIVAFNLWSAAATWLWQTSLKPVFDAIGAAAEVLWRAWIQPYFQAVVNLFVLLGDTAAWLWGNALKPLIDNFAAGAAWLWDSGIRPMFGMIWNGFQWLGDKAVWLYQFAIQPFFSAIGSTIRATYDNVIKPAIDLATGAFDTLGRWAQKLHDDWIKPWFDKVGTAVSTVLGGFEATFQTASDAVGRVWAGIRRVVAEPINWVIDLVYTNGIKAVWDAVAGKVGLDKLPSADGWKIQIPAAATGGIYPGYTPGRDIGVIAVSGGEAIMRPEWTRAVGPGYVAAANRAAVSGGVGGVQSFIAQSGAPYLGGFDLGGIVGGIGDTLGDIGGGIADFAGDIKKAAEDIVRGAAAKVVEGLLAPIRAMVNLAPDSPDWMLAAKRMPLALMDGIVEKIKGEDAKYASGSVSGALEWAKGEAGKPYQWGGSGNPSWDCSGFMAAIQQVILGQKPQRLWTTFDFAGGQAPSGWQKDLQAPFMIGISNIGPGHTAGTLLGTNVESRGGDGVIVGPAARGWNHPMFYNHYGFKPSLAANASRAATGQLADWIGQALSATDTPPPGSLLQWLVGMTTLVNRESGGNPLAINTTDSNARAGNASRGIAQVVPTTFAAFREPSLPNDIWFPPSNLAAAINWIKFKYGNISNVQQANPNLPAKGYALGGIIPMRAYDSGGPLPPGLTLAYNGTNKVEQTYTHDQDRALRSLAARGAAASTGGMAGGSGAAVNIENYHQHTDHSPRQIAEELRVLARGRGPR